MKTYIITGGDYSDYHIAAVAETIEEAQMKAARFAMRHCEEYRIEVWDSEKGELDSCEPRKGWNITVNNNGTVECEPCSGYCAFETVVTTNMRKKVFKCTFIGIMARDEAHAKKIAFDMLAELKAAAADVWWLK